MNRPAQVSAVILMAVLASSCQQPRESSATATANHVLQELLAAWAEHEPERLDELFTENGIYEDVPSGDTYTGPAEIKEYLSSVFSWAPDLTMKLTSVAVSGDTVVTEWTMQGTQTGPFDGFPATGNRFSVRGASVTVLENGKIRRNTDYYDMATFLLQLGAGFTQPEV
jgi:steroid delta-isomerase-like uncharacterized protein